MQKVLLRVGGPLYFSDRMLLMHETLVVRRHSNSRPSLVAVWRR